MPTLKPLQREAETLLAADRVDASDRHIETMVDVRYVGQSYELSLDVAPGMQIATLARAFHQAHAQKFGHSDADAAVEIVNLRVLAVGKRPPFTLPQVAKGGPAVIAAALIGERELYFPGSAGHAGGAWQSTPIYDRTALQAGNKFSGPAVIEEVSSTTLVRPNDRVEVDAIGNLIITIGTAERAAND